MRLCSNLGRVTFSRRQHILRFINKIKRFWTTCNIIRNPTGFLAMESSNNTTAVAAETENITADGVQSEDNDSVNPEDCKVSNLKDAKDDSVTCEVDAFDVSNHCVNQVALTVEKLTLEPRESFVKDLSEEAACASALPSSSAAAALLPTTQKPTSKPQKQTSTNFVHRLKWITWHDNKTPIVTQNENGPCPLIAIANVLLLSRRIHLPSTMEEITADQLIEYIGDTIFENIPKNLSGTKTLDYEQNMNDAMAVLPRLQTGLDVNIKFTGVQDFEYTAECIIFDLLNIPLYHGWLVDPQAHDTVSALGNLGYNQLVEKIIANKCSREVELSTEALIAEEFLEKTASQLTVHGLCELNAAMRKNELAVLFRNNHFITILKKGVCGPCDEASSTLLGISEKLDHLYQLVTDQGFLHESRVVWETLSNIEGDETFVDANFVKVPPKSPGSYTDLPTTVSQDQQINHDYLLALSLQEDQKQLNQEQGWELKEDITSDEELARRIQEDEQKHLVCSVAANSEVPSNQIHPDVPSPHEAAQPINEERNKKGSCVIL